MQNLENSTAPVQQEQVVEENAYQEEVPQDAHEGESAELESLSEESEGDESEIESEPVDANDNFKKHFRKLEKKIKKENKELNERLAVANHQLQQYNDLFTSTYANAYTGQQAEEAQPQDEVEAKVLDIIKRRDNEAQKKRIAEEQQNQRAAMLKALNDAVEEGSDRYDDFDDVVLNKNLPISEDIAIAATFLPNTSDVLYALGKNPDELRRITSIGNYQSKMKALSTFAFNLNSKGTKMISNAPKPTANPQLKDKPSVKQDPSRMSYDQLKAYNKSLQKQRTTRKR